MDWKAPRPRSVLVISRFRLRSALLLPMAFMRFRALYRSARRAEGFIKGTTAIAPPNVLINVSLWRSREEMLRWVGCLEHVNAVRQMYGWATASWSAELVEPRISASATDWS